MKFFFDNNLPPRLAQAIQALMGEEHVVRRLKEGFPADTSDADWLNTLGSEGGWVVICGDPKILRRPHELRVLRDARLLSFFLKPGWTNLDFWVQAHKLVHWWPVIMETAKRVAPPACFLVPVNYSSKLIQGRLD
ncbi:MAG: hypothetical protein HY718_21125 [Planctomycetes bacterium]|nr:hypothetical protein [Planctomycetota bacterium]